MEIQRGQITCVALIFAIIGAGLGGFLLNAKDVEVDATDYNYITDVSGAFHGTGQDIPVDFNPRENVTGYYYKDPQGSQMSIGVPSLKYHQNQNEQGQQMPNNYPYLNTRMSTTYYEIAVDFARPHGSESPAMYNVKVTNMTPGDDFGKYREFSYTSSIGMSSKFFIDRSDFHWPDIYHWWVSQTNIGSYEQQVGCIANLGELLNRTTELSGKHVIFDPISDSMYPAFGGNIRYSTHDSPGMPWGGPGTLGETTWYEFSFDQTSRAVVASTATDVMTISDVNYPLSDGWLAWGGRVGNLDSVEQDYDTSITFRVTAAMPDETMRYINPNYGVSPMSTYGAEKEIIVSTLFSDYVSGSVYLNSNPYYDKTQYTGRIWVTIGDENNDWDRIPLAVVYIAGLVYGDTYNHIRAWRVDGDGNQQGDPVIDIQTGTGRDVHKYISWWTVGGDVLHLKQHQEEGSDVWDQEQQVQIPRSLQRDGKIQIKDMRVELIDWDPSSDTSWSAEKMTLECQVGPILKKEVEWQTNHQAPTVNPDDPYGENSTAVKTWFESQEIIEIPIESNVTYWSNGYYNSTIGQIISLINEDGSAYQTTKLNLKLHTEDNDYWVYNDPSKMSIMISTDSKGGIWIGNVGEDGSEHQMIQVGNATHVYLEYRVENGRLHLYQSPIYQFTDFMNYYLLPVVDCTSQIPAYGDLACKSIQEISYYVPLTKTQEEGKEKVHLTVLPRHLIVRTIVLLDAGGLYIQDGELSLKDQFPQYTSSEFIVNAVVHPGDSMSIISGSNIVTIGNDGVDKWVYKDKTYDWWEIKVFYVAQGEHGEGIWINGQHLANNHAYIQAGKYGALEDLFELTDKNLTIKMDGVWAFSTQYYEGVNTHTTIVEFDDPGTWHWSKEEFMVVFVGILAQSAAIMYHRFGFNAIDLIVFGGAAAIIWVMFR